MSVPVGTVYLVGAGPGDPGLITVRGLELLRQADVIIHDRLISHELLDAASDDAERIFVGKCPGTPCVSQKDINNLLVDRARRGDVVIRLKGGDPFVFGRGFEEMSACREAGVPCIVVPGVSSALAVPESVGIPLTQRRSVRAFAVMTGHFAHDSQAPPLDYNALARLDAVVILMGHATLAETTHALIEAGRDADTPVACIEWGTTPRQRVVVATLATITETVKREGLDAPMVTVVGDVAALAEDSVSVQRAEKD